MEYVFVINFEVWNLELTITMSPKNARLCFVDKPKLENKQQSKFEKMLGMEYFCPGIGNVRLMVGVRRRDKTKIQYCITALTPVLGVKDEEKSSHK